MIRVLFLLFMATSVFVLPGCSSNINNDKIVLDFRLGMSWNETVAMAQKLEVEGTVHDFNNGSFYYNYELAKGIFVMTLVIFERSVENSVSGIIIGFQNKLSKEEDELVFNNLKKKFGEPDTLNELFYNDRVSVWRKKNITVSIRVGPKSEIHYRTKQAF